MSDIALLKAISPMEKISNLLYANIKNISAVQGPTPLKDERNFIASSSLRFFVFANDTSLEIILFAMDFIYSCFLFDKPCSLAHLSFELDMTFKNSFLSLEDKIILFHIASAAFAEICCPTIDCANSKKSTSSLIIGFCRNGHCFELSRILSNL